MLHQSRRSSLPRRAADQPLRGSEHSPGATALRRRLEKREGYQPPGWHCHIADAEGNELTVGVTDDD
jgi:hypothetical protein